MFTINTIINNELFQITVISICLACAQICEQLQIPLKLFSARNNKVATGYNNAMKAMVLGRFFVVIYFFSIAFSIETGAKANTIFKAVCLAFTLWTIFNVFILLRCKEILKLEFSSKIIFSNLYGWVNLIAIISNLIGLTLPHLLASIYTDYRMTIGNLGFIFNALYTLLMVFFTEKKLSNLLDAGVHDDNTISAILYLRSIAGMLALLIFYFLYKSLM